MKHLFQILMPLLILPILAVTGCVKELEVPGRNEGPPIVPGVPLNIELVQYLFHIESRNGEPPANHTDLIWNNRGHTPIIAPDGHQVTLGEFLQVRGLAEVTTPDLGTNVAMDLQGLIPGGLYSLWVLTFEPPGFHGTYDRLAGYGTFAMTGTGGNTFTASSSGTASISGNMNAQQLSAFGSVRNCLCTEYEVHIMAAYHSNNLIKNGDPGDLDSWITHFMLPLPRP